MKPWDHPDYKHFLKSWIAARPHKGRGELRRIANFLGVHTTLPSHVINGDKDFSHEQIFKLATYLGLSEFEREYLYTLHARDRAGTFDLKHFHQQKLENMTREALKVKHNLKVEKHLGSEEKQTFYSSWIYSATRLLTSIPAYNTIESLMKKTGMERQKIQHVLDFLVKTGLCRLHKQQYTYGPLSTHVSEDDPLVMSHHKNWRIQSLTRLEKKHLGSDELMFTMPVVLTKGEAVQVKKKLLNAIEEITEITDPAPCENLYVLNLDWFEF